MGKVIGIDLGSTLSEVAIVEGGKATVIANEDGSYTTPSVVMFKDGDRQVGSAAKRQLITNPKGTVNLIKRFMGATYKDSADAIKHVQYDVVEKDKRPYVKIADREYSAEEVSSMIVAKMKKVAENYTGQEIKDAVITVPAFFSDAAKAATKLAGELAGLNVLRIVAEPTAAILSSNIDMKKDGKYMVVDFGGSTLDNSVADISDNVVEILSSYGDVYCGGSDIDNLLTDYITGEYKKDSGIDLTGDPMAVSRVKEAAEKAKIELTASTQTDISLPYITVSEGTPMHLNMTITRAKLEQIIKPIVDKVISCGKTALEKAGISAADLDGVLLIGGSCRIPLVQQELVKAFGDKLLKSSNMDLAVAEGAAIQGSILSGEDTSDLLLLDVTPISLGIETMGGVMTKLIDANTTIPCKKSQIFSTAVDNQTAVTIHVLQGERPMAGDNKSIGNFNLDGIAPARRGVPQIEVTFNIDANGILSVQAQDKATGKEQKITIENSSLSQEEIDKIKADAEMYKAADEKKENEIKEINEQESYIYSVENTINDEQFKDKFSEDDKKMINEELEKAKAVLKDRDLEKIKPAVDELKGKFNPVIEKIYKESQSQQQPQEESKQSQDDIQDADFEEVH